MGTAASVANVDREQLGDRIEVTKSLPVESFGHDKTTSANGAQTEKSSSASISDFKYRDRAASKHSKSRRSLGALLGLNTRPKGDEVLSNSCTTEVAEFKISRLTNMNNDLQQEKERLKRELESLKKSNAKWKNESDNAREQGRQAIERAKAFEDEVERVKKKFQSFTNEKEIEHQNLVKRIHELENCLKFGSCGENSSLYALPESVLTSIDVDADVENLSLFKAPGSLADHKVPDFNTVYPLLSQVMTNLKPPKKNMTFRFFLSADKEARRDATFFIKVIFPQLQQLCTENGKFLIILESYGSHSKSQEENNKWESHLIAKCDLFFGIVGNSDNSEILAKWRSFYNILTVRRRPMFFCFKDSNYSASSGTELTHFLDSVGDETKVSFYTQPTNLVEENYEGIQEIVKQHFDLSPEADLSGYCSMDISDEELISDCESSLKQLDILRMLAISTDTEVGFSKYYEQLDKYIGETDSFSPLLVNGAAGSGKTTLLAKWVTKQLASGENVMLYSFVGCSTNDVFTSPAHVMRRITSQLLGLFPCLCSMLHCDPVKCEEYFPKLLKTVPAKISTNIVIVIDGVDKLQNANSTHHLNWLSELLPPTVHVILSVTTGNEPSQWKSWKTVNISPLTFEESRDVFVSCWRNPHVKLSNDEASEFLNKLDENAITSPLFLTMLSHDLANKSSIISDIHEYSLLKDVFELTVLTLKSLHLSKKSTINQVLALICASRSGLGEAELMEILGIQWSEFEPVVKYLIHDYPICREVNDIISVSHEQMVKAIHTHLNDNNVLRHSRERLVKYFSRKLEESGVSASVIDQLPWLLVQLNVKDTLKQLISRNDVFHLFFKRSLFSDLLGYWSFLNVESSTFGNIYMDSVRSQEGDTSCLEVALRYEILGRFLKGIGVFSLAMKCLERALDAKEMMLEADDPWVGQSLHHLADLYVLLGNLQSAEASYRQTLAINESTFGKDHPLVAKELECLAYVKNKQEKERACKELKRKAARIRRKFAFPYRMSLVSSSNSVDCRLIEMNNLGEGRTTPEVASSLHNVGVLLQMDKKYKDAEMLFKKSLAMREALFGEKDLAVTDSLDRLASLCFDQKMYPESVAYYKKSLEIRQEKVKKDDPNLISNMNRLAIALRRNGNLIECESTYRNVLKVLKATRDAKDPMIATALHNLAVINSDQKKLSEALNLFKQALKIYEENEGENHPKVAESLKNMAKVHLDLGNSEDALSYLLRCQMIQQNDDTISSSRNSHADTISSSHNSHAGWMHNSVISETER